jgi:hypothetical protein
MDTMVFLETIMHCYSYTRGGRLERDEQDPGDAFPSAISKGGDLVRSSDRQQDTS